jgi:hypothetical protein
VANSIRAGYAPSGRAVEILQDIYAKSFGRRNSEAYESAWAEFAMKIEEPHD